MGVGGGVCHAPAAHPGVTRVAGPRAGRWRQGGVLQGEYFVRAVTTWEAPDVVSSSQRPEELGGLSLQNLLIFKCWQESKV